MEYMQVNQGSIVMKKLNLAWRVFATGASFTLFGLGGLLFGLMAFPPLLLISDRERRRRIARRGRVEPEGG